MSADLGLLAFSGFAVALHEATRTTSDHVADCVCVDWVIVAPSGAWMAFAAGVLLFSRRLRQRQDVVAAGLGMVAADRSNAAFAPAATNAAGPPRAGAVEWHSPAPTSGHLAGRGP